MKKKAIEKIPYLKLPAVNTEKEVKYVGVTAVKIIDHEKHLFLEIYRNKEKTREIPLVRIVCTKKDFASYIPEKEQWTRQKIETDGGYGTLIWYEQSEAGDGWQKRKCKNACS